MTKYHISPTGEASKCRATVKSCPFGGDSGTENHYDSMEEARTAYENSQNGNMTSIKGNKVTPEENAPHGNKHLNEHIDRNTDSAMRHFPDGTDRETVRSLLTPSDAQYRESRIMNIQSYRNAHSDASWNNVMGDKTRMTNNNIERYYDAVEKQMDNSDRNNHEKAVAADAAYKSAVDLPARAFENDVPVNPKVDLFFENRWDMKNATKNHDDYVQMREDFEEGKISPRRVVGTGYKNARKVAAVYLDRMNRETARELETAGRSNSVLAHSFYQQHG